MSYQSLDAIKLRELIGVGWVEAGSPKPNMGGFVGLRRTRLNPTYSPTYA